MTDYFALFDQPRRPWLDREELKQAFHARTLRAHPDADPNQSEGKFAEINEAYQVLRDPKRRLQHLLTLEGDPPSARTGSVPREMESLFPMVAALTHESDAAVEKVSRANSALSRSLLKSELLSVNGRINETLTSLRTLQEDAETQLQQLGDGEDHSKLHALYSQFSYVTKWIAELEEKQLRVTAVFI